MQYVTVIEPVLEVTLVGSVDDQPWLPLLREEGLPIASNQGRTHVMLSAVDAKYNGLRFRELSVSIQVGENRFFLIHAYNSIGWFAWVERQFFRTPYYHGQITTQPQQITLHEGADLVFEASLPATAVPTSDQADANELTVHLPKRLRKNPAQPQYFYARLEGQTKIYTGDTASLHFAPTPQQPVWKLLQASNFQVQQWRVRAAARHSKSKTYEGTPDAAGSA